MTAPGRPAELSLDGLRGVPRGDVLGPYPHPPGCTRSRVVFRPGSEAASRWPHGAVLPCFPARVAELLRQG